MDAPPPRTTIFGLPMHATSPVHAILPHNATTLPLNASLPLHATAATCAHRMMLSNVKVRAALLQTLQPRPGLRWPFAPVRGRSRTCQRSTAS